MKHSSFHAPRPPDLTARWAGIARCYARRAATVSVGLALAGCLDKGSAGPQVNVAIAPLVLPDVLEVCYTLSVHNGTPSSAGNQVWRNDGVCSTRYGNEAGGDIAYIGPCDADTPSASNNLNYVDLTLKTIEVGPGEGSYVVDGKEFLDDQFSAAGDGDADFENPCPASSPCQLQFECRENQDVQVVFDLTVMGDANQGFFDIAVNFEDIFCSAKYDSCYSDDEPIQLLFGDDTDRSATPDTTLGDAPGRDRTGVFAMACTAGQGNGIATEILMSRVTVTCATGPEPDDGFSFDLPISGLEPAAGNHSVAIDLDGVPTTEEIVEYATYFGNQSLDCGTPGAPVPCNQSYLNIAINLEDLPAGCTLSLQASAQDTNAVPPTFTGGHPTVFESATTGANYPFIAVNNASLDQAGCVRLGLDAPLPRSEGVGNVTTFYQTNFVTTPDSAGPSRQEAICHTSKEGGTPASNWREREKDTGSILIKLSAALKTKKLNNVFEFILPAPGPDGPVQVVALRKHGIHVYGVHLIFTNEVYGNDSYSRTSATDDTHLGECGVYPTGLKVLDSHLNADGTQSVTVEFGPYDGRNLDGVELVLETPGGLRFTASLPAGCGDRICTPGESGPVGTCQVDCAPTCTDLVQNGGETGIDCGGSCAPCSASIVLEIYGDENNDSTIDAADLALAVANGTNVTTLIGGSCGYKKTDDSSVHGLFPVGGGVPAVFTGLVPGSYRVDYTHSGSVLAVDRLLGGTWSTASLPAFVTLAPGDIAHFYVAVSNCNDNGLCDSGETTLACPMDCSTVQCDNNGMCDPGETALDCPMDCSVQCDNNGMCDPGETALDCPMDCSMQCDNNGMCDPGETALDCPMDNCP